MCVYACVYACASIGKRKRYMCSSAALTTDDGGGVTAFGCVCLHERAACPEQRAVLNGESLLPTAIVSIASALAQ